MNFALPLVEEKVKKQHIITLHLIVTFILIATGAFLLMLHYLLKALPADKKATLTTLSVGPGWGIGVILAGIALLIIVISKSKWLLKKNNNRTVRAFELLLLLCFASLAAMHSIFVPAAIYGVAAAATLFAIYWESVSENSLFIHIDNEGVRLPVTSRKRFLNWGEVEQVLLRFGILTIDCSDNRLYQWNIKAEALNQEGFQQFCNEQIAQNKVNKKKNDW